MSPTIPIRSPAQAPNESKQNLAVRVRGSLNLRLDDIIHDLRHEGIRSSKAELVELLLWELPTQVDIDLKQRLARFRQAGRSTKLR